MNKLAVGMIYMLVVLAVLALFFSGCAGPGISMKSSTGFTHEASVRVPFQPPEDSVASLYIDDEGTTVFIKHIEIHHGSVNPQKEFWREIYKIDKTGTIETEKFGPFEKIRRLKPEGNLIAFEDLESDNVTYIDMNSLTSRSVIDIDLADIIRNQFSADYYDSGLVVYTIPVPEKPSWEKGIVLYNTLTHEEIRVNLDEEYVGIGPIDIDGDNILLHATEHISKPPVLYVIGLDGTQKLKLTLYGIERLHAYDAKLIREGLIVATRHKYSFYTINATDKLGPACLLKRYSFDGEEEWSYAIPITGSLSLKLLPKKDSDILSMMIFSSNNDTSFIGYFTADEGKPVYTHDLQRFTLIWPTDTIGNYYLYRQWSGYCEVPAPKGRIAFYSYDRELASIDFNDGIYYFATSPSGKFFAVVTYRTVSIFSRIE